MELVAGLARLRADPVPGKVAVDVELDIAGRPVLKGTLNHRGQHSRPAIGSKTADGVLSLSWSTSASPSESALRLDIASRPGGEFELHWSLSASEYEADRWRIEDVYALSSAGHWFGGGELCRQHWPLETLAWEVGPYYPFDNGPNGLGNLLHPHFFTSSGAAIAIDLTVPYLHLGLNPITPPPADGLHGREFVTGFENFGRALLPSVAAGQGDGFLHVQARPYDDAGIRHPLAGWRTPRPPAAAGRLGAVTLLRYTLSAHRHGKAAMEYLLGRLPRPAAPPPECLFRDPIWTTWARYKMDARGGRGAGRRERDGAAGDAGEGGAVRGGDRGARLRAVGDGDRRPLEQRVRRPGIRRGQVPRPRRHGPPPPRAGLSRHPLGHPLRQRGCRRLPGGGGQGLLGAGLAQSGGAGRRHLQVVAARRLRRPGRHQPLRRRMVQRPPQAFAEAVRHRRVQVRRRGGVLPAEAAGAGLRDARGAGDAGGLHGDLRPRGRLGLPPLRGPLRVRHAGLPPHGAGVGPLQHLGHRQRPPEPGDGGAELRGDGLPLRPPRHGPPPAAGRRPPARRRDRSQIGGNAYGNVPERELVIRWAQANALLPSMQARPPPSPRAPPTAAVLHRALGLLRAGRDAAGRARRAAVRRGREGRQATWAEAAAERLFANERARRAVSWTVHTAARALLKSRRARKDARALLGRRLPSWRAAQWCAQLCFGVEGPEAAASEPSSFEATPRDEGPHAVPPPLLAARAALSPAARVRRPRPARGARSGAGAGRRGGAAVSGGGALAPARGAPHRPPRRRGRRHRPPSAAAAPPAAGREGRQMVRPVFWAAPEDGEAAAVGDEFMLGDDVLVAPVMDKGAVARDVYLPAGRWRDVLRSGGALRCLGGAGPAAADVVLEGGRWHRAYPAPLDFLPWFERVR